LDEIPQLWHVIAGEMSLVGPRPLTATELARHYGRRGAGDPSSQAGTRWAVAGVGTQSVELPERRSLDLKLARNRSLRMYLQVLLRTIPEVLRGSNSW